MIPPAPRTRRRPSAALAAAAGSALLACVALAVEEPRRATVEDMDMGLLQRNLLKLYVCEKEAGLNARAIAELKDAVEVAGDPLRPTLRKPTEEELQAMRQREKDISHYLLFEKTNAVQMIRIVDRVLGTDVHLAGEGRAERVILEKKVDLIEIPRNTDIRVAARIISDALGCPVKVEQPDTEIYRIWFTMGPTTGEAIIKQVCSSHNFEWRFDGGVLIFRHRDAPASGASSGPAGGDDGE